MPVKITGIFPLTRGEDAYVEDFGREICTSEVEQLCSECKVAELQKIELGNTVAEAVEAAEAAEAAETVEERAGAEARAIFIATGTVRYR